MSEYDRLEKSVPTIAETAAMRKKIDETKFGERDQEDIQSVPDMMKEYIKELNNYPFPNLIAEIIESGYGMHTISDFMGYGRYDTQKMIEKKLRGEEEFLAGEAFRLAHYYRVKMEYLFANTLLVVEGKPEAYWKWRDKNKGITERDKAILEIYNELREEPYLLDFMKAFIPLTERKRKLMMQILKQVKNDGEKADTADGMMQEKIATTKHS